MGIARLKRLVAEDLSRSFTTNELQKIVLELDPKMKLHKLTGYPSTTIIPRKEASVQILEYFHKKNQLNSFLSLYYEMSKTGYRGEKPTFHNMKLVIKEFEECGLLWNEQLRKVVYKTAESSGWGYLQEGTQYNFCFVSVDICANSRLVVTYPAEAIAQTYSLFQTFVTNVAKKRNGVIWSWEGDGGLVVFHLDDMVNQALYFAIDLLESMPIFNATLNQIQGENICIRAGIHAGAAEYKHDTASINSEVIKKVRQLEKHMTQPLSISLTTSTYALVCRVLRDILHPVEYEKETIYRYPFSIQTEGI